TFATNSPDVLRLVREVYGRWADLPRREAVGSPSDARVEIVVAGPSRSGAPGEAGHAGVGGEPAGRASTRGAATVVGGSGGGLGTLRIDLPGGRGTADPLRSESRARVTPGLVANRDVFVEELLEPLTLFLLSARDRQPVHAAAVGRGDTAVLLAGPSGAGKSTLAYAASRSGFRVLADEPVYVQLHPRLRVWGRRSRIHLTPEARDHFPELAGVEARDLPSGKRKVVVDPGDGGLPYAERAGLCILAPGSGGRPSLEPVSPERAVAELATELDPGYDLFADTIDERIARVAEGGAWRLRLTRDPQAAVPLLGEALARVGAPV
ncbi:MAG TPA: hypothetical protein VLL48_13465, partial [Longimicrobiales bacterium]|nr:hypothetical protein [Longimicrobiales bacterium]